MKKSALVFGGVCVFVLWQSGCASAPSTGMSPTASVSTMLPTLTPPLEATQALTNVTPSLVPTNTPEVMPSSTEMLQLVAAEQIDQLWWSSDATILYYYSEAEGSAWAYDLSTGLIQEANEVWEAYQATPEPPPGALEQLSENASSIFISPSGNKILYLIVTDPIPTARPTIEGEPPDTGENFPTPRSAELWLWENGETRKLGETLECIFRNHLWTPDEQRVVIRSNSPLASCHPEAVVDLQNTTIRSLEPYGMSEMSGLSPDGTRLLYSTDYETLRTLNVDTLEVKLLDTPEAFGTFGEWIDNQTLLLDNLIRDRQGQLFNKVGIFNLETSEYVELINFSQIPSLMGSGARFETLSPDRQWLAFYAFEFQTNESNGLLQRKIKSLKI